MTKVSAHPTLPAVDCVLPALAMLLWPAAAHAGPPKVGFDVSYSVECREITSEEFAKANPDSKIIEARFQVSSLLRRGEEEDIKELMYVIWSPEKRLRAVDFEPKTQVGSDVAESIAVVEKGENAASLDGAATVHISPLAGVEIAPSAGASKTKKHHLERKYSRLPPKQLLIASGTTNREHGVFFKLKPSSQDSLEGRKEFVCMFVVPSGWRGDYAYVDCAARPRKQPPWTTSNDCGSRRVLVGLYLRGYPEAREAAERLAHAYEAYVRAGSPTAMAQAETASDVGRLLQRLPGSSLVESVIDDLAAEDDETSRKRDQAWESFRIALEDIDHFTN